MSPRERGEGRIYRRGAVWWIQYSHRGRKVRESSESKHFPDAVRLLRKRLSEMAGGHVVGHRLRFPDLVKLIRNDYTVNQRKSWARVETSLTHLRGVFGTCLAQHITADELVAYVNLRAEQQAAPSSIQNELAALKRMLNLARKAGKYGVLPPFPILTVQNTRQGFCEARAYEAICARLPAPERRLVTVAYLTGWRTQSELQPLPWSQVDMQAGVMRLEPGQTKNSEGRTFPFDVLPALRATLQECRAETEKAQRRLGTVIPWVFHRNGKPIKSFRGAWEKACEAAGYPEMLVHDFRRTAVRNLERSGVSRSVAMKLTGHKTESIFRRYAIVNEADLREGVQKLAVGFSGTIRGQKSRALRGAT